MGETSGYGCSCAGADAGDYGDCFFGGGGGCGGHFVFDIIQWGVFFLGELGGVLLFFFLVYSRGMKRAFVFGERILLGVQGRN